MKNDRLTLYKVTIYFIILKLNFIIITIIIHLNIILIYILVLHFIAAIMVMQYQLQLTSSIKEMVLVRKYLCIILFLHYCLILKKSLKRVNSIFNLFAKICIFKSI